MIARWRLRRIAKRRVREMLRRDDTRAQVPTLMHRAVLAPDSALTPDLPRLAFGTLPWIVIILNRGGGGASPRPSALGVGAVPRPRVRGAQAG